MFLNGKGSSNCLWYSCVESVSFLFYFFKVILTLFAFVRAGFTCQNKMKCTDISSCDPVSCTLTAHIHTHTPYVHTRHINYTLTLHITLSSCTQGIEFLDVVLVLCNDTNINQDILESEVGSWLTLLLQLIDITGNEPALHLKRFISGKDKVVKQHRLLIQKYVRAFTT